MVAPDTRQHRLALGIDIGGTGVKAALVDLADGHLVSRRARHDTPVPATPAAVAAVVGNVVSELEAEVDLAADLPVGCGLPGVVKSGRLLTAANIDRGWLAVSAEELIGRAIGRTVQALNDADAAGLAEMEYGAGRDAAGTVLLLTIGTGIGSALFREHRLVPNTELGHIEFRGHDAETQLSGAARQRRELDWPEWAAEFNEYLGMLEAYLWPDLIILGGGVSKSYSDYRDRLTTRASVRVATFRNSAGIVGAALHARGLAGRHERGR